MKIKLMAAAAATALALSGSALAEGTHTTVIDISGWQTWTTYGPTSSAVNSNGLFNLGGGLEVHVTGVSWDVNYVALGESWQNEVRLGFRSQAGAVDGFNLSFGGAGGPGAHANAGGPLKLADFAIPDLVLPNGILYLESFESFDDGGPGVQDAVFGQGSFVVVQYNIIPAPGALALLGVAGLAGIGRRRRA